MSQERTNFDFIFNGSTITNLKLLTFLSNHLNCIITLIGHILSEAMLGLQLMSMPLSFYFTIYVNTKNCEYYYGGNAEKSSNCMVLFLYFNFLYVRFVYLGQRGWWLYRFTVWHYGLTRCWWGRLASTEGQLLIISIWCFKETPC